MRFQHLSAFFFRLLFLLFKFAKFCFVCVELRNFFFKLNCFLQLRRLVYKFLLKLIMLLIKLIFFGSKIFDAFACQFFIIVVFKNSYLFFKR